MLTKCARNVRRIRFISSSLLILLELLLFSSPSSSAQQPTDNDGIDEGPAQVQTRGPVHEAFAAPLVANPKPGPVLAKSPPKGVEELPPDQKPVGANVQWIPGYWQWDEGRNDFLWISGVWRDPPPGRQWVPGYWNQASGGFQWVPGAWIPSQDDEQWPPQASGSAGTGSEQPVYLPSPPVTLEVGPSSPAPVEQVFWTPGCWTWQGARYLWRPGFWAAVQPGWVWMPSQYVWTPSGYLFVQGYWDLPIASRGLLFAPVYYPQPVYLQPGYVFTPSVTIVSSGFTTNLFVQPAYSHYCFGDYYAQSYLNVGIYPWFSMSFASGPSVPRFHDPLFSYYSVVNVRNDPRWVVRVREEYVVRRDNVAMRPPRTLVEQTRLIRAEGGRGGSVSVHQRVQVIARPVGEMARHSGEPHAMRLERVNSVSRQEWRNKATELRSFREERIVREREGARTAMASGDRTGGGRVQPRPMNLAHSPIASRPAPAHASAERRPAAERPRREEIARAREPRPSMPARGATPNARPSEPADESRNRRPQPAQTAARPPLARSSGPRTQAGATQPGPQHSGGNRNPSQANANLQRNPNHGPGERRVPPRPTPYQRERREHEKR